MKFAAINTTALIEIGLTVTAVGLAVWFIKNQTAKAYDSVSTAVEHTVTTTLNPASPENAVYSGVNAAGSALTGQSSFDLGTWVYDVFHPGQSLTEEQAAQTGQSGAKPLTTATGW